MDKKSSPGLYLVSTPIGNLGDITLRALDVLKNCDSIACEDKRVSAKLLNHYGIRKTLMLYHDFSNEAARATLVKKLEDGASIVLISDAGTPLIADPGYKLVQECLARGINIIPIPGANAILPALQISGLPTDQFVFGGFLPNKDMARRKLLEKFKSTNLTLVFYETAKRMEKSLAAVLDILGDRRAAIIREITKKFEEGRRGKVSELLKAIQTSPVKGECVIVVTGAGCNNKDINLDEALKDALINASVKEAVKQVCDLTSLPKNQVYARALEIKKAQMDKGPAL